MLEFRTQGFNGYSVKYSPFFDSRIAVASAANFGLVGNGRLYILSLTPRGIVCEKSLDTQDSLFDVSWSEAHENQLVVASGDGSIKLFDIGLQNDPQTGGGFPIQSYHEHKREVFATHWNLVSKTNFCSSSWDGTIKIWSPERTHSILTLPTHSCTYSASWSPHSPSILSSVSSDSHLRVFDLRTPPSASNHLTMSIPIHAPPSPASMVSTSASPGGSPPSEALTHDWNKYRPSVIATAGVDRLIRIFDLRSPPPSSPIPLSSSSSGPVSILAGHEYAVRRLAWSPHHANTLLSASYDMTCRVWTDHSTDDAESSTSGRPTPSTASGLGKQGGLECGRMDRHTEFVTGVDWCLFGAEGWVASCGWDERVLVWDVAGIMAR